MVSLASSALGTKLADQPTTPLPQWEKVTRRRKRDGSSSAKKPHKQKPRVDNFEKAVDVKGQVAAINASTDNTAMSGANQRNQGTPDGATYADAMSGNKGETFVRNFIKMDQTKRDLRDNKDEKKHRRTTKCNYDALAEHRFVGHTYTVEEMMPMLKPTHVVGIIMAHSSYKSKFIQAIIDDISSFCTDTSCLKGIDKAIMGVQSVEENYPRVTDLLFNDPSDKLRTIVTFRNEMVQEHMLKDKVNLLPALKTILTIILKKTKHNTFDNEEIVMDWKEALLVRFEEAVELGAAPEIGSNLEHRLATGLNLHSSNSNRNAVASMSQTQHQIGKQTAKLSKAVISDKLDKLGEVIAIRNLDMIVPQDSYDVNLAKVKRIFNFLQNVKEFFALSIEKKVVYIRFHSLKSKFMAEKAIKDFRSQNPEHRFTASRPNLETFCSDLRLGREEIREKLLNIYSNALRQNNLGQYIPTPEAFKRGVFLDEQHWWEKGKLRTWVEFTDPTNCLAVLTYSFGSDPFVGFQWGNPIPNPRFRAIHPGLEYQLSARGVHVINNHTKQNR